MEKTTKDFSLLKKYLKQGPNMKVRLAFYLGYSSSNTIDKWLERKKIPRMARIRVLKFIERHT